MAKVIAVMNQKGGVGKTTTAIALGAEAAKAGRRTLLVDADPQANLTGGLGLEPAGGKDLAWLMDGTVAAPAGRTGGRDPFDAVVRWDAPASLRGTHVSFDVLPASDMLAATQLRIAGLLVGRETVMARSLAPLMDSYDTIVVDGAPTLDVLTTNCLAFASTVIVPSQAAKFSVDGINLFLGTIAGMRSYNPALRLAGVLLTMYQAGTRAQSDMASLLRKEGAPLLGTVIPRGVAADKASMCRMPVTVGTTAHTPVGTAYRDLAHELESMEVI